MFGCRENVEFEELKCFLWKEKTDPLFYFEVKVRFFF